MLNSFFEAENNLLDVYCFGLLSHTRLFKDIYTLFEASSYIEMHPLSFFYLLFLFLYLDRPFFG